jgi:putative FmdB family regulatory protein
VPTYQYACTACGHKLEAVQSFADEPLTECPSCEGRLRKQFSSVGVVFKGSGFYRNDSRTAAGANKDGANNDGANKDGANKDGAAAKDAPAKDSGSTGSDAPKKTETPAATPKPAAAPAA